MFILFQDKLFTVNFTRRFIDGLNVTGVVNRIVAASRPVQPEVVEPGLKCQVPVPGISFFCLRLQNNLVQKTGKTLYYFYNSLKLEPKLPAPPSKKFSAPSPHPWFKHLFHHSNCIPALLGDSDATGGLSQGGQT